MRASTDVFLHRKLWFDHRDAIFFQQIWNLDLQDHTHSPNNFWLTIFNGEKKKIETSLPPSSPSSCTVVLVTLEICGHATHQLNALFLWLSLELQHGQKPTHDIPTYSSRRRNHSSTLHQSMQHHQRTEKPEHALSHLAEALEGMLPFLQHLCFGSSIPPLCRARQPGQRCRSLCTVLHWAPQMYPPCRQKGHLKLQRPAALHCYRCLCPAASRGGHNSQGR